MFWFLQSHSPCHLLYRGWSAVNTCLLAYMSPSDPDSAASLFHREKLAGAQFRQDGNHAVRQRVSYGWIGRSCDHFFYWDCGCPLSIWSLALPSCWAYSCTWTPKWNKWHMVPLVNCSWPEDCDLSSPMYTWSYGLIFQEMQMFKKAVLQLRHHKLTK